VEFPLGVVRLSGIRRLTGSSNGLLIIQSEKMPGGLDAAGPVACVRLKTIIHFFGIAEKPANPLKFIIFPDFS
jgi:hypothetical protein